jgi:hypothetical protein
MGMRKLIVANLIVHVLAFTMVYGDDEERKCNRLLKKYEINRNLKSYTGWLRVCKNDKISLYANKELKTYNKIDICRCFKSDLKDRSIEVFKGAEYE